MGERSKFMLFLLLSMILLSQFVIITSVSDIAERQSIHQINRNEFSLIPKETEKEPFETYVNLSQGFFYHSSDKCPSALAFECSHNKAETMILLDEFKCIPLYEAAYRGFKPCPQCVLGSMAKTRDIESLEWDISQVSSDIIDLSLRIIELEKDILY